MRKGLRLKVVQLISQKAKTISKFVLVISLAEKEMNRIEIKRKILVKLRKFVEYLEIRE